MARSSILNARPVLVEFQILVLACILIHQVDCVCIDYFFHLPDVKSIGKIPSDVLSNIWWPIGENLGSAVR